MADANPSVILAGVAPNSGEVIRQNNADQASLVSAGTDLASKQNVLATQMLSAAAGTGDQNVWNATLNHVKAAGISTDAIPTDVKQGADWAQAARLAQSPLGTLLNTTTKLDSNSNQATIAAGNNPADPNAATHALLRNAVTSQYGPAAGQLFDNHVAAQGKAVQMSPQNAQKITDLFDPTSPQATPGSAAPDAPAGAAPAQPAGAAPAQPAVQPQTTQNAQATVNTIQQHYAGMDPRDQARIASVTQGAAQLKPFLDKGDTQGAMNFLQQRKQQLAQQAAGGADVDTQDTDAAIQMLQSGQVDQLKQTVDSLLTYGQAVNAGQAGKQQDAGATPKFVPPANDPAKTQAANQAAYQQALEAYKADPATVAANAKATAQGAASVKEDVNAANTGEMYNKLYQNLEALRKLVPDMPEQGLILSADDQANISQRAGKSGLLNDIGIGDNQKAANAVRQWDMINHSQILNGLGQLAAMSSSGGIRVSVPIVKLMKEGNGISAEGSQDAKLAQIDALEAELRNTQAQAQNVKSDVSGGSRQDYSQIPVQLGGQPAQGGFSIKRIK